VPIGDPIIRRGFAAAVAYRNRLVRSPDLFAWGGESALRGTRPARDAGLRVLTIALDDPALFSAVDTAAPEAPGLVAGTILSGAPGPVALAVNGRIAATGRSWLEGGVIRFALMVSRAALRVGANRLAVYAMSRSRRPK
jgi:hypothetical protein